MNIRETMYIASIKNKLTRSKTVRNTIQEDFSLEEVKSIMLNKSPTCLFCLPYSEKKPCVHITKLIMPSHHGVYMYYDGWADKTPKYYNWKEFYNELLKMGLENIRF